MRFSLSIHLGVFVAGVGFLVGCDNQPRLVEINGTVKVDGQPIEKGSIAFIPEDGAGTTGSGQIENGIIQNGQAPVGKMKVTISAPKVVSKKKLYDTPGAKEIVERREESLPPKYSSREHTELRYEVKPGVNTKDWDLQTK